MVNSFIFSQETIASIQERLEILERCLNEANVQDETTAEIFKFAKTQGITVSQLLEKGRQLQYKLNKFNKLSEVLNQKTQLGESAIILCVRANFILKEIFDQYWYLFLNKDGRKTFRILTEDFVEVYKKIKNEFNDDVDEKSDLYILVESLKHKISSLIEASVKINAISEEEINTFDLGDITPQQSEAMLISLASTKKWDWVYRNLT
ncbi:hypothetical protein [Aulosira sp. FACHB-615]|uniref:hypothetical protein n=1 Tax=Aulosira sp. FACHB-615 TaxID=2692777 RepID=UPI001685B979|nr:hypothetical protein [Aulosira sp. FACHB-615]MBD2492497.1 hypothetical protein [Aulosira sp. FACHB-615]